MEYLQSLSTAERDYYCEVIKLVKLILVMPATNAVSEQSFSAFCRLKTWLRSTTSQAQLNWSIILHIHKERTDRLPMLSVANFFLHEMTADSISLDSSVEIIVCDISVLYAALYVTVVS